MLSSAIWAIFNLVWGFLNLFSGYRIFRLFLALSGAYIGLQLAQKYFPTANPSTQIVIMVIAAVVTAFLALAFYNLIFTLIGGVGGFIVATTFLQYYPLQTPISWIVIVVGILIGIALGTVLKKVVVVFVTAAGGASFVIQGFTYFLPQFAGFSGLIWLILFILGVLSQMSQHPL